MAALLNDEDNFFVTLKGEKMQKIFVVLALLASMVFAGTYSIDKAHSRVGFKVKHMMIANVYGNFSDFSGKIVYDEQTNQLTMLKGVVQVTSINTEIEKRDKHLRSSDFFHVDKYPTMSLKMLSSTQDELVAELTIKNISKKVTFDYENNGIVKDPWGNTKLGFSLETKVDRKEFGLMWNKVLETGGLVVGDRVRIMIDIEAKKN